MSDFDTAALADWLEINAAEIGPQLSFERFSGGQSNPTYRITTPTGDYVLRRQPFGSLLPSAHAVDREFRLLSALHPVGFPVPRVVALCEDPAVIGARFYVMKLVEGRIFWNGALPDQAPSARRNIYEAMIMTLARLHSIDPSTVGLQGFGRPGNYFERQIRRWTDQYRASQTEDNAVIELLIDRLPDSAPEQTHTAIIHGDYRIDNLIYTADTDAVAAVLDWELATLGDPLADFTYLAMNWVLPVDGRSGLAGIGPAGRGIPSLEEAVAIYCAAAGRERLPSLHWYFAYNLFRLIGIIQGVKKRLQDGNAAGDDAHNTVARLAPLVQVAGAQARLAGL